MAKSQGIKALLIQQVLLQLQREFETLVRAADQARGEATHAETKQEGKYDTRGLEASYLAHGQSKRAAEIQESIEKLRLMEASFTNVETVAAGALVVLDRDGEEGCYFVLPYVGGMNVREAGMEFKVISTGSPLGKELLGRGAGDEFKFNGHECVVVSVE